MAIEQSLQKLFADLKGERELRRSAEAEADRLRINAVERTSEPMVDMAPGEVDAKIGQAKAEGETALAVAMGEVRAEFAALRGDIKALPGTWTLLGSIFGTGLVVVGLVLAALAYGGDNFNTGRDVGGQMAQINAKLDRLSERPPLAK